MSKADAALIGLLDQFQIAAGPSSFHSVRPMVAVPQLCCIERNLLAAMKVISVLRLSLAGDEDHFVSLDQVIRTMRDTGRDMLFQGKERSKGGLAVNAIGC